MREELLSTLKIVNNQNRQKMDKFSVEYFRKTDGTYPVEEFILSQNVKIRSKIFRCLDLLAERGNELREPYSKDLEDGILEIRTKVGSNITRVLYFFVVGKKIILTNGFTKKTQETPKKEIEIAKKYRLEYQKRGEQNGKKFQRNPE